MWAKNLKMDGLLRDTFILTSDTESLVFNFLTNSIKVGETSVKMQKFTIFLYAT